MESKKMTLPTRENVEKAIKSLEGKGHRSLRSFIQFMKSPEILKRPLGDSDDCITLKQVINYYENKTKKAKKKISNSTLLHIENCDFCKNLVEDIPEPKKLPQSKMNDLIEKLEKTREEKKILYGRIIHKRMINQFSRSVCFEFPQGHAISPGQLSCVFVENIEIPLEKTKFVDCNFDGSKELKIILSNNHLQNLKSRSKFVKFNIKLKNGEQFLANQNILELKAKYK